MFVKYFTTCYRTAEPTEVKCLGQPKEGKPRMEKQRVVLAACQENQDEDNQEKKIGNCYFLSWRATLPRRGQATQKSDIARRDEVIAFYSSTYPDPDQLQ